MSIMSEQICMVCGEWNTGICQIVRLREKNDKTYDIVGHLSCTDKVWEKIHSMKDFKSMKLDQVLKELNLKIE